jgi:hypothetical protein
MSDSGAEDLFQLLPEPLVPTDPPLEPHNDTNIQVHENEPIPAEEEEVEEQLCKICRLGTEEGNPLYYPCKCSVCSSIEDSFFFFSFFFFFLLRCD